MSVAEDGPLDLCPHFPKWRHPFLPKEASLPSRHGSGVASPHPALSPAHPPEKSLHGLALRTSASSPCPTDHCAQSSTESQCPGLSLASTLPALGAGLLVGRHSVLSDLAGLPSRDEANLLDN